VVGADVDEAAKLLGPVPPGGQSPFAMDVGNRFEHQLRRDDAARLREAVGTALDMESPDAFEVVDLDRQYPWTPDRERTAQLRRQRTLELLQASAANALQRATLVLHPRFRLEVFGAERDLEPDALILGAPPGAEPLVVEIKAFVDHQHRTDLHDLAQTRLQAAVYAVALRRTLAVAGLDVPRLDDALIVLRRPGSMFGSAGIEEIRREIERVERVMATGPHFLVELLAELPDGAVFDDLDTLRGLAVRYVPSFCQSRCGMSLQCRGAAHAASDPAYFGSPVADVWRGVSSLRRAHRLVTGLDEPATEEEEAIVERLGPLRARIDAARQRCS